MSLLNQPELEKGHSMAYPSELRVPSGFVNTLSLQALENLSISEASDRDTVLKLHRERLCYVIKKQEEERNDKSFSRDCLFCKRHYSGNRSLLFHHLMYDHNFHIGSPDNIVFGNELLDILTEKLEQLKCFYCEKTFKDWQVLKEHMRKKQHKRINPQDKTYDKFYIVNYLESDVYRPARYIPSEEADGSFYDQVSDEELMECDLENNSCQCLLCDDECVTFEKTLSHMKEKHLFDFQTLRTQHGLDFYSQVKVINYIRKQVDLKLCFRCDKIFSNQENFLNHMVTSGHSQFLPDVAKWDHPMHYFSTKENDNFLCSLDDETNSPEQPIVYAEDISVVSSLLPEEWDAY